MIESYSRFKSFYFLIAILAVLGLPISASAMPETGCWFLIGSSPIKIENLPIAWKTIEVDNYFRVSYDGSDPYFADSDRDNVPDRIQKQLATMTRSRHFLQTELGWPLPATRTDMGKPQLDVYLIMAGRKFTGAVYQEKNLHIVLNRSILKDRDFGALWIHQLAHAASVAYKSSGEFWFYEATAGWMEGQFEGYSATARKLREERLQNPDISLTNNDAEMALGASGFLDVLSRPVRDVIRQAWEQWSYTRDGNVMEVIRNVLAINHLPDLDSYLQNYYLLFPASEFFENEKNEVELQPYSAFLLRGVAEANTGGVKLSFTPDRPGSYSSALLFYTQGERSGTLALKKGLIEASSSLIPFAGLDHYRYLVINGTDETLTGAVRKDYDASVPGTLEYFRVSPEEGGVQIEWKTARENGVAFWNLYRMNDGQKVKLNDFPIPAAIHSEDGIHYIFVDVSGGSLYTLEAITSEGFPSPLGTAETSQ